MTVLFEIKDRTGRIIRLTDEQWKHIAYKHTNISIDDIKDALCNPQIIKMSKYDETVYRYYRLKKERMQYIFVPVKYLNGTGFIITAYYVRNIQ